MRADQTCDFLSPQIKEIDPTTVSSFRSSKINGKVFLSLSEEDIKEIGCTLGERKSILLLVNLYKSKEAKCCRFYTSHIVVLVLHLVKFSLEITSSYSHCG